MFSSLNEIVSQQGQTLNRLEDNLMDTKANTSETVIELTETVKNESSTISERVSQPIGQDMTTTCVTVWFIFAIAMFVIDFGGAKGPSDGHPLNTPFWIVSDEIRVNLTKS